MMSGNYTSIDNQSVSGSVPAAVPDPGHLAVKFQDSHLQTFPPSEAQGKIAGGARLPRDADDTFSKPVSGSDESQQSGWLRTFSVSTYKSYFDVDTSDVLERIKDSLLPFSGAFNEKTSNSPDLYGPFWICTTLIFVAAAIGTFVTYVAHKVKSKEWEYDINVVQWSGGLFYGYVTIVPLVLYVILKYFSAPAGLVQLFCLYGYSLFVFIPALSGQDVTKVIKDARLVAEKEIEVREALNLLNLELKVIGNLVPDSVPILDDETTNAVVRSWGEKQSFMKKDIMAKCAQLAQFDEVLYKVTGEGDGKNLIATAEPLYHEMMKNSEEFYQMLNLPCHVVSIVSGALNDATTKMYDLEGWFPASQTTLTATERIICCILGNYQKEDGVERNFLGGVAFLPFKNKLAPEVKRPKVIIF